MLTIEHVTKTFGSLTAVDNLNLQIPEREMFGLLGANGAGKTTTFRMILGLLSLTDGNIRWKGQPVNYSISEKIGYLPEERGLYPKVRVSDQLVYLARLKGMRKKMRKKSSSHGLSGSALQITRIRKSKSCQKETSRKSSSFPLSCISLSC